MAAAVDPLLARIAELAPEEVPELVGADVGESEGTSSVEAPAARSGAGCGERAAGCSAGFAAGEIRAHLARMARSHDERGRRTRDQPHAHARPAHRTRRSSSKFCNSPRRGSPSKVSDFQEKHEFSRMSSTLVPGGQHASQKDTFRGHRPTRSRPITTNDLLEFSELEMDRYDDFNILSRSLTEISADVTEVLTQLEGFMGRVDSDIDEFTKLAHHLQDEITAARMVPIGNLYTRAFAHRPRRRKGRRKAGGAVARRRGNRARQQYHPAHFRSADSSGAQCRRARDRGCGDSPPRGQARKGTRLRARLSSRQSHFHRGGRRRPRHRLRKRSPERRRFRRDVLGRRRRADANANCANFFSVPDSQRLLRRPNWPAGALASTSCAPMFTR